MPFLVYHRETAESGADDAMPYSLEVWRPSAFRIVPPSLSSPLSALLWCAHYARVFHSREYQALLLWDGNQIVHRTCVIPACFRWPFMAPCDLQISSVWTHPDYRGRGLATWAVRKAMRMSREPGRSFWYITRENNSPSIALCTKAGFRLVGHAVRSRRLGMRIFGRFVIKQQDRESP
jgi:RimJ/RimL family protein N-acetyltransferase